MPNHPRFRNFNRANEPVPPAVIGVQAISGACMLVRRRAIETIGLMDSKRLFLHFEDLDWCLRFGNAGLGVLFVPDARVEHAQGVCSKSRPIRVEYQKHRSMIQFLRKHFVRIYPAFFMTTVSLLVTLRFCLVLLRLLFRSRSPSF